MLPGRRLPASALRRDLICGGGHAGLPAGRLCTVKSSSGERPAPPHPAGFQGPGEGRSWSKNARGEVRGGKRVAPSRPQDFPPMCRGRLPKLRDLDKKYERTAIHTPNQQLLRLVGRSSDRSGHTHTHTESVKASRSGVSDGASVAFLSRGFPVGYTSRGKQSSLPLRLGVGIGVRGFGGGG